MTRHGNGGTGCCALSPAVRINCRSCTDLERRLIEWEVPWLPGFDGARPVRVGNAAAVQLQLDVYGEIADAIFQARLHGLPAVEGATAIGRAFLDHLEAVWREPDEGNWEVRGPRQHSSRAASGSSTI